MTYRSADLVALERDFAIACKELVEAEVEEARAAEQHKRATAKRGVAGDAVRKAKDAYIAARWP